METNGGPGGTAFKNTGKNLDPIRLFAGGGSNTLSRFTAVQFQLDNLFTKFSIPAGQPSMTPPSPGPWDSP